MTVLVHEVFGNKLANTKINMNLFVCLFPPICCCTDGQTPSLLRHRPWLHGRHGRYGWHGWHGLDDGHDGHDGGYGPSSQESPDVPPPDLADLGKMEEVSKS